MRKLLVDMHSFVDVITNSSSEIFVCDTDKSTGFTEDFLRKCLNTYNFGTGASLDFEECFGPIEVITEETVDAFIDEYVIDWGLHRWSWKTTKLEDSYRFRDNLRKTEDLEYKRPWDENREYNEGVDQKLDEKWNEYVKGWKAENMEIIRPSLIGNLCIHSNGDNSIPYELFEMIERALNANRLHLG